MVKKEKELEQLINKLCTGRDKEYKIFIKNMILNMMEGDKWEKLSKVREITDSLKKKHHKSKNI